MGMFDDLIPAKGATVAPPTTASTGMFDDLIPKKTDPNDPGVVAGTLRAAQSGVPILGPLANKADAAISAARPAIRAALGIKKDNDIEGNTFGERYQKSLEKLNQTDEAFQKEHPGLQTAGEIAGGVGSMVGAGALPLGAKLLGLTGSLGRMTVMGGLSGAGIGAADEALRGGDPVQAGALGGAVGAIAPGAGRVLHALAAPVIDTARGIMDPEGTALRKLAREAPKGRILSDNDVANAQAQGQPVSAVDISQGTRNLARSAANTSPEAQQELEQAMSARAGGAQGRIIDYFHQRYGDLDPIALKAQQEDVYRKTSGPAYKASYAEGDIPIWNSELERLTDIPMVQDAMRGAITNWKNQAGRDGYGSMNPQFTLSQIDTLIKTGGKGMQVLPNLQFWDYTTRELQNAARKVPGTNDAGLFNYYARSIKDELDDIVPSFKATREGAFGFIQGKDALQMGQKYATSLGKDTPQIRAAVARMSPENQDLFQKGFISQYVEKVKRSPNPATIARTVDNSQAAREQLAIGLGGTQHADELQAFLHTERMMDMTSRAVSGNSTTARQLQNLALAGGIDALEGFPSLSGDPSALVHAGLMIGMRHGASLAGARINQNVANQVARLLATGNTQQINTAIRMIAQNRPLFQSVSHADAALAAILARSGQSALVH